MNASIYTVAPGVTINLAHVLWSEVVGAYDPNAAFLEFTFQAPTAPHGAKTKRVPVSKLYPHAKQFFGLAD